MAYTFPSEDWTQAFRDAVNANEAYSKAGKPWTFGRVAMVLKADPARGVNEDTGMILDVHGGSCRGAEYVHGMDAVEDAEFIIVADYDRWREVIEGRLDPIKAMMEGKLRLEKGSLPTMIRFVESSRQLVESATRVPTTFLD
jgi:putative sterol carrier protein